MQRAITVGLLVLFMRSAQTLPQTPTSAANGSIEGIVVRSDNGAPIAGAQVTLTFAPAVTPGGLPAAGGVAGGVIATSSTVVAEIPLPLATAVAAAQVGALGLPRPTFQPVVTGPDGKFVFKDLAAGGYRIAGLADGYVRQEVGQRAVNGQGRPVFVSAGQTLKEATVRLIPTGTVSGRVFDENGQPATGTPVQLVRAVYNVQGRNLQSVANGIADDRGDYRIFAVPPGRYYLLAGTPPGGPLAARGGLRGATGTARFSLLYYPAAESVDQASIVEVKSGEQITIDMRLRRQIQTYRVRGRIVDGTGSGLPANLQVSLAYRFLSGGGSTGGGRVFDPATGAFELQNVAPGDWTVTVTAPTTPGEISPLPTTGGLVDQAAVAARQAQQAARPSGAVPVKVVDGDIENLIITLSPGSSTTGRVRVEGQQFSTIPNPERLRLSFLPLTMLINQSSPIALPPAADGSIQVVGLRENEYRVQFSAAGVPGMYVKSVTYGGDDVLNKPLKFSGTASGTFDIVLRSGTVPVTGTVTNANAQPEAGIMVALVPAQRGRTDLFRTSLTDQTGRFTIANVPPGEYKAFSWEAIDPAAYLDPDFLKQYEQQGKAIQITEGSTPHIDVRMIAAP